MRFDNNLFVVSDTTEATQAATSGGFTGTALYQKMAPEYQQGAGWLFAADLTTIAGDMPVKTGMQDVRYFLATSKVVSGGTLADSENRASVTFAKDRTGVASWLGAPGPMGSLNFVSPDAGFVVTTILKNPTLIVDDMVNSMSKVADQQLALTDLASAFGGEVTVALDGPLLPVPALKFVAEVYDPGRINSAFQKLTTEFNTSSVDHSRTGNLSLTESVADGQPYYTLKLDKLPWEADWTLWMVTGLSRPATNWWSARDSKPPDRLHAAEIRRVPAAPAARRKYQFLRSRLPQHGTNSLRRCSACWAA